ncbi:MAG: DUF512 domain-containing protein [Nitrospirae bacterium]|nr:DUF512 domain-containing protein [Nitrospirota bacterium]
MSLIINHVTEGSIARETGIKKDDIIIEVNGRQVKDLIDYMFYSKEGALNLKVQRGDKTHSFKIKKKQKSDLGFDLKPFKPKLCRNKCIFCFVDQLPNDMRKTLYIKDDDYRMSFLYGNYVTLTNLSDSDKKRIFQQRLSPLYISVHTTNNELRRKILGNPKTADILKEIQELTQNKIKLHTQIVLMPGVNDGNELSRTIKDLCRFYPYVASIAVVPVGLTMYGKTHVKPVEKADAQKTIEIIKQLCKRFKKRHGDPIVYAGDELYIKADMPFPSFTEYGDLPQIENGVGMIPAFLNSMKKLKLPKKIELKKIVTFTGASFAPYLSDAVQKLKAIDGLSLETFRIENKFFGSTVTVAGLLTGRDVLKTLMGRVKGDCLLIPDVMLKYGDNTFLDNLTLKDMEEHLNIKVKPVQSSPEGLIKGITDECKRKD